MVERGDGLVVQVQAGPDEDDEELAGLAQRLRARLLDLDVDSVDPLAPAADTEGAKGVGAVLGGLVIRFATVGALRSVLATVAGWATRTGHSVEVRYGEDRLVVTGVTSAQQERIIDDFITRHAPSP